MKKYISRQCLSFCFALILAPQAQAEEIHKMSRDLHCNQYGERAKTICQSASKELDFEWLGHAIVSPGWNVSWATMRRVYCKNHITIDDTAALDELAQAQDWRLQNLASGELMLLQTRAEAAKDKLPASAYDPHNGVVYSAGEQSVFNPRNAQYILKGGCKE